MKNFFAVLGGMGSIATESYVRLVNKYTHAQSDQEFLDYVVFNDASVPDRTAYILDQSNPNPLPFILDDIAKATQIGASFIVLACNTAHYFYDEFQASTPVPILHMPHLAVESLSKRYPAATNPRIGFLGTVGSIREGVYRREIEAAGYDFIAPPDAIQDKVTYLIYEDIKKKNYLDRDLYFSTLDAMFAETSCDAVILGCTELSVLAEAFPYTKRPVVDAQLELAQESIRRAKALRVTPLESALPSSPSSASSLSSPSSEK